MLRFAKTEDTEALLDIYGQYMDTPITFEYELPLKEEFAGRIRDIGSYYPYLVWEENGKIAGYGYAHRHMERAAYQWNAELSVYVDKDHHRSGIGGKLYQALIEILQRQNIHTVYGCITLPNEKSVGLHEAMGFTKVGIYHHAGYKCGKWHDVIWYEKAIREFEANPQPIRSMHEIPEQKLAAILKDVSAVIKS